MEEQKMQEKSEKREKEKKSLFEHHKGKNGEKVKRHLHDS